MNWLTQWKALSARTAGLLEAGSLYYQSQVRSSDDPYGTADKQLLPRFKRLYEDLDVFSDDHLPALPRGASTVLTEFLTSNRGLFTKPPMTADATVRPALTALAGFRAEFEYQIADLDVVAQRRVARAFLHLQRSIVADAEVRAKWERAFQEGETACERLGAVHLLSHGIWAFKVSGEGERTDLVLQEPIVDKEVLAVAESLVLTEWKKAEKQGDAVNKARVGRNQAKAYSVGVLAGVELSAVRYVVVVTSDWDELPDDESDGQITYRYVGIAVSPAAPSRSAARVLSKKRLLQSR